jgi:hypothetical protein
MSQAYQYTADGYYAGENEDYGLLPNNATYTAPEMQDGYIPRWTGAAWEQVENHKGKEGYVGGEPFTVKEYGPLPGGWSDTPPPPPPLTGEALIRSFMESIQNRLDDFARTRSYDDARACVAVYLGCANATFAAEAAYMQGAIVATWEWTNGYTGAVLTGEKPMPESWADFEAELDAAVPLAWPVPDTRVTAASAA